MAERELLIARMIGETRATSGSRRSRSTGRSTRWSSSLPSISGRRSNGAPARSISRRFAAARTTCSQSRCVSIELRSIGRCRRTGRWRSRASAERRVCADGDRAVAAAVRVAPRRKGDGRRYCATESEAGLAASHRPLRSMHWHRPGHPARPATVLRGKRSRNGCGRVRDAVAVGQPPSGGHRQAGGALSAAGDRSPLRRPTP